MEAERAPPVDVRPDLWRIVQGILKQQVPQFEVWAFGSRATGATGVSGVTAVKGRAKPCSDLDLAVITREPLSLNQSAALAAAFEESDLPWKVDIVDWAATPEAFRRIIAAEHVVVQAAAVESAA